MARRRINLSVDPGLYTRAEAIARRGGFRSLPEMCGEILRQTVEGATPAEEEPERDEIEEMFDEYSEYERHHPRKANRLTQS